MKKAIITCLLLSTLSHNIMAQAQDITELTDAVYMDDMTSAPGTQATLSVQIKNTTIDVRGFQFDLYLPEGINFATDADDFPIVELSTVRTTSRKMNYFDCAIQPDGALRVLANSSNAYTLSGTSGEVCTITINIAPDIESGNHPIHFKNVIFTDPAAIRYSISETTSILNVTQDQSSVWGDLNNDGEATISDVVLLVNHILTKTLSNKK